MRGGSVLLVYLATVAGVSLGGVGGYEVHKLAWIMKCLPPGKAELGHGLDGTHQPAPNQPNQHENLGRARCTLRVGAELGWEMAWEVVQNDELYTN